MNDDMNDDKAVDLIERVAKLEERINTLACLTRKLDNRLWYVLAGIILSILMQLVR